MEKINQMIIIEKNAADFYKSCISGFKDKGVVKILSVLANNVQTNQDLINDSILQGVLFESYDDLPDNDFFSCLADCGCAYIHTEEIETYITGSDMEQKIISQYKEIKSRVNESRMMTLLDHLIRKHKDALFVLDDMIEMLNRKEDWVESAEFTIRRPY